MFGQRVFVCMAAFVAIVSSSTGVADAQRLRGRGLEVAASQAQASEFYTAMLAAVNAERAKQNIGALCYNKKLQKAAQLHSEDQVKQNLMTHTGSDGSTVGQRVTAQGFKWNMVAENVAAGQVDVASVMNSWMNSEGHRKNIMNKDYKYFGMGYGYASGGSFHTYWTQDFGASSSEGCDSEAQNEADVIPAPAPAPEAAVIPAPTPAATTAPTPAPTPAPTAAPTPAPTPAKTTPTPPAAPAATPGPQSPKQVVPSAGTKKRDCHAE